MISEITLKNFRNFENKKITFLKGVNLIFGENGKGKTNILEAVSLFSNNQLSKSSFENLIKSSKDSFFINSVIGDNLLSIAYEKETKKKIYTINNKKTTKQKFFLDSIKSTNFSPMSMNIFIMPPTIRRQFMDDILKSSFSSYEEELKSYEKILKSRNAVLKIINEQKGTIDDLSFWDNEFIKKSLNIYRYRYLLKKYYEENISTLHKYMLGEKTTINFKYISKINFNYPEKSIKEYLKINLSRDIILGRTSIGPHVDDFDIRINNYSIKDFASRGETKSMIIGLKLLEAYFIESKSNKKPILIIDDLMSELDEKHKSLLFTNIKDYQVIISNINNESSKNINNIKLY